MKTSIILALMALVVLAYTHAMLPRDFEAAAAVAAAKISLADWRSE